MKNFGFHKVVEKKILNLTIAIRLQSAVHIEFIAYPCLICTSITRHDDNPPVFVRFHTLIERWILQGAISAKSPLLTSRAVAFRQGETLAQCDMRHASVLVPNFAVYLGPNLVGLVIAGV